MTLLIADDSTTIRYGIKEFIKDLNLKVVGETGDGNEALKLFEEHLPDLVTLDITMPGMDGIELMKQFRKINNSARVLVISALRDQGMWLKAEKLGARGFLQKPFDKKQLLDALNETITN